MLYIISPVFISLITENHKNFDQEHETIIYIIQVAKILQSPLVKCLCGAIGQRIRLLTERLVVQFHPGMLVFQGKLAFKAFLFLIEASNLCFYFRGTTSNERPFEEKVWSSRAYLIYTRPYIFPYFSRGCAYLKHCKSLKQRTREPRSHPR